MASKASQAGSGPRPSPAGPAPPPKIDPEHPNVHRWDNGLVLYLEFLTLEEEAEIIRASTAEGNFGGIGKRMSLHYGPQFDYTTFAASETDRRPLPEYLTRIRSRLPVQEYLPDQFTIQYYPPGVGIPPHVDTHSAFREALYSLSLGSAVPMAFKRCGAKEARRIRNPKRSLAGASETSAATTPDKPVYQPEDETDVEHWEVMLPPRSLLLMTGASRYGFTHQIRGRKSDMCDGQVVMRQDRYSITMRTVNSGADVDCRCDFPEVCDARIREEERMAQQTK